ncbi:hypothetical protein VFPPC_13917 [Pochonia chlamydosporia 170]|uniref:Uncharacterized protein n=1 Tax=Pochonia chlamydosporia 170 TaxID=1380566 RepID=A0A179FGH7_METCM|nr:hypothetical protein VFPPC_13917 [Pochonia chlamydosporia 170]OAQ64632.1 hypothetical protein VFPPC_13917 [Pochonia chlamydosporia 170]
MSFLSLPSELRIEIYKLLFFPSGPLTIYVPRPIIDDEDEDCYSRHSERRKPKPSLEIIRTNKQIYRESLPLLYQGCKLCFVPDEAVIAEFLDNMPEFARFNIQTVGIKPQAKNLQEHPSTRTNKRQVIQQACWLAITALIAGSFPNLQLFGGHLSLWKGYELVTEYDRWVWVPLETLYRVHRPAQATN